MIQEQETVCCICGAVSKGMHFGIEACRACAAFFRRSIILKRKYVCRSGTNQCKLSNVVRNACRKCRLQKCFDAGMLKENVQPCRDLLRNCEEFRKRMKQCSASISVPKNLCDNDTRKPNNYNTTVPRMNFLTLSSLNESTPTEDVVKVMEAVESASSTLFSFVGYAKFCKMRINMEIAELYGAGGLIPRNSFDYPKELKLGTFKQTMKIFEITKPLYAEFLKSTFECYRMLPLNQKWELFRQFLETLSNLECHFFSKLYFPNSSSCIANSFCTYVDLNQLDQFFGCENASPLAKLIASVMQRRGDLLTYGRDFKVDRFEMAALVGLTLFSEGTDNITQETKNVIKKMQQKIFYGLHYYYAEILKLKNYAYRLGESISLLWTTKKCGYKYKNTGETAELFGLYSICDLLYKNFGSDSL